MLLPFKESEISNEERLECCSQRKAMYQSQNTQPEASHYQDLKKESHTLMRMIDNTTLAIHKTIVLAYQSLKMRYDSSSYQLARYSIDYI